MKVNKIIVGGYIIGSLAVLSPIRAADKESVRELQRFKATQSNHSRPERPRDLPTDENNNNTREPNRNTETRKNQR